MKKKINLNSKNFWEIEFEVADDIISTTIAGADLTSALTTHWGAYWPRFKKSKLTFKAYFVYKDTVWLKIIDSSGQPISQYVFDYRIIKVKNKELSDIVPIKKELNITEKSQWLISKFSKNC